MLVFYAVLKGIILSFMKHHCGVCIECVAFRVAGSNGTTAENGSLIFSSVTSSAVKFRNPGLKLGTNEDQGS